MVPFAPFERGPALAVAVSGGADSMALCLLADQWMRRRGGRVVALVVDHRLRRESAEEVRQVADWLGARGIAVEVLCREGPRPAGGIQAAARTARYRLLTEWCRSTGVLHLALAHHRDDQAETVLLRLACGSGVDGLAAMAGLVEGTDVRLIRPLLGVPGPRLRATLEADGQHWIEDPSNRDPGFARVRLRGLAAELDAAGLNAYRLGRLAGALGRARGFMERAVADFLATAVTVHPAGFCRLDPAAYRAAPDAVSRRALVRLLLCVGGGHYPPRRQRLERLHRLLADERLGGGRTLGGCRILRRRGGVLICREADVAKEEQRLVDAVPARWDRRFVVGLAGRGAQTRCAFTVARLGRAGWAEVAATGPVPGATLIPGEARAALPAFFDLDGVVAVPHLRFIRAELGRNDKLTFNAVFKPAQPLGPAAFAFTATGR